jgi:quinoprotein relay system zinc metallohydrolase 1
MSANAQSSADLASLDYRLTARAVAEGVYVVTGANADFAPANGCNIINTGFIVSDAGVLVINSGPSRRYGQQLRALIARTTQQPVVQLLHLNHHPDYFLGNQAFADVPRLATPLTRAGMARDAKSYEDNLYRLCGEWMKGTEAVLPSADAAPGVLRIGQREFELIELQGHTASDLVLIDRTSGVAFAGGLVFAQRVPTTPHASIAPWLASLSQLQAMPSSRVQRWVPSHGDIDFTGAIAQTQAYLQWLQGWLGDAARRGLEINEVLRLPVPAEQRALAAFATEYVRNVVHLYPRYEQAVLQGR